MPSILPPLLPSSPAHELLAQATRALDAAEQRNQPATLALSLAQVGRCYRGLGELASAEWYLQKGLRWARTLGAPDACIELLCDLAEVAVLLAEAQQDEEEARVMREHARDHGFEATQLAHHAADPEWEMAVLLRVSEVLDRCGDHEDSIALQCRVLNLITGQQLTTPASPVTARMPDAVM
jgi:hypothetical protein